MFTSILFKKPEQALNSQLPEFFYDLNLDKIVESAAAGIDTVDLRPYFYTPLTDPDCIRYRQQVMTELDNPDLCFLIRRSAAILLVLDQKLTDVKKALNDPMSGQADPMTHSQCLHYAGEYCAALEQFFEDLSSQDLHSAGLTGFAEYLKQYLASNEFCTLKQEARQLEEELLGIPCCMHIKDGTFRLRPWEGEADINQQVSELFARFQQKDAKKLTFKAPSERTEHYIDAQILTMLSRWNKALFAKLETFAKQHIDFFDAVLLRFCREVQFYLRWQALISPLRDRGLAFCYPILAEDHTHIYDENCFDLALALKLNRENAAPVSSSFALDAPEQILVTTGPNQGGKTTFARGIGQLFYLASLGCCIPGSRAQLFVCDGIYTHFNREEDLATLSSRLQDDLDRLKAILDRASRNSLILVNEIFASTTLEDALFLGRKMLEQIIQLGCPTVCVTFLDELASLDEHTVSMMSTVDPNDPTQRTYHLVRKSADGLAYAESLAQKYNLTYEALNRRLG